MAAKTFDKETLLDLTVNFVPLGIILFFIIGFAVVTPWEPEPFTDAIGFGLLIVPFVALAVLTFFSGKAISQAEKSADVYHPGQAAVTGSEPKGHTSEGALEESSADASEGATDDDDADETAGQHD